MMLINPSEFSKLARLLNYETSDASEGLIHNPKDGIHQIVYTNKDGAYDLMVEVIEPNRAVFYARDSLINLLNE